MIKRITDIIIEAFTKLFSLALKQKAGELSFAQMDELVKALIQRTASDLHQRTVANFVTDN